MAFQGPAYGLSRECMLKSKSKFNMELAMRALDWIKAVTNIELTTDQKEDKFRDQFDFGDVLKDGIALCTLLNTLSPNTITKINTSSAPFKQRENIEMFLKGCEKYGLKSHDLFQVNDLYENKNLYMVVTCLHALGGLAQKKGFVGPVLGVKMANENKRNFTEHQLNMGKSIIGLQAASRGASQANMTPYGACRQIIPDGK